MKRWFWPLVFLVLIGLVIWFIGPYLSIGEFKPLESVLGRLIALGIVMLLWGFKWIVRAFKAQRAAASLTKQVMKQEDPASARASADAKQLQQRFTEAVDALQRSKKGRVNLYALPWYIIIGPPGSGKTTAIVNSGLNFPLAQKFGKEALRGVGGTRNCDWWFTEQAILLDTAGRYTTQDSDRASDAAGWSEFLNLLRKYRKRRPINGVVVAMSVADLASQSESERAAHVAAIRARLSELDSQLKISLPVYLMLTKCDLLAGFSEFFDDLTQEARAQVWGVTFPLEMSRSGTSAQQFPAELEKLFERVNTRMMARLEAERDVQRRALIFGFPSQLAGAKRALCEFVQEVCEASAFEQRIQLRGVYLTSGTQEGMPIDRMLGALARTFGLGMRALNAQANRGKAYFINRLLTEVMFRESGLAGVNRRIEVQQALVQSGSYVAIVVFGVLGMIALSVSYARNRSYLKEASVAVQPIAGLGALQANADLPSILSRLDAFRHVLSTAEQFSSDVPLLMRMGLYQGNSVRNAADDAYVRELNGALVPALAALFRARLDELATQPDRLYQYLKAYLMLREPQKRLDSTHFGVIAGSEWNRLYPNDPPTIERIDAHVKALLSDKSRIQPASLDDDVIGRARTSLKQASIPVLMYSSVQVDHAGDDEHAIHLDKELGVGGDSLFVRKSGKPLGEPFPALYTRRVFDDISSAGKLEVAQEFVSDSWVLGEGTVSYADAPRLASELMRLYEDDYIRAWDALLADISTKQTTSQKDLTTMMALLASPSSPLKRLLSLVEANTNLLKPLKPDAEASLKTAIAERIKKLQKQIGVAAAAEKPGLRTTQHFAALHKLVDGPPGGAPIDQTMRAIGDIQKRLEAMGGGLGDTGALENIGAAGQANALGQLRVEAMQLPPPISTLVSGVGSRSEAFAKGEAGKELAQRYQSEVASECRQLISGRYPFSRNSGVDVALDDFARLFGTNGVFDAFFTKRLAPLVNTATRPWRWKEGAEALGGSATMLAQFQAVERIRQIYFRSGGAMPELRFTLTPDSLDASVRRLGVEIDGQTLEYRHGPPRAQAMVWPGPSPGQAAVVFEEGAGTGPNRTYQGPWAAFRLFDDGNLQPQSELRFLLTLRAQSHSARLLLEASSVRNPFASNELRDFRCGG